MHTERIELVLFDVGGVLVDWIGTDGLSELADSGRSRAEARRFWLESPVVRLFEKGKCSPEAFSARMVEDLDLKISPEEFIRHFLSWDRGPYEETWPLLEAIDKVCEVGCLSNNNVLHWTRLREETRIESFFKYRFLSHEIGMMKPDPEIFEYVLANVPYRAGQILFLDDSPECVEGARKSGFNADCVKGPDQARQQLQYRRLLPARPGCDADQAPRLPDDES